MLLVIYKYRQPIKILVSLSPVRISNSQLVLQFRCTLSSNLIKSWLKYEVILEHGSSFNYWSGIELFRL